MALLALGGKTLLGDELFGIDGFGLAMFVFASEGDEDLRVLVLADCDKV